MPRKFTNRFVVGFSLSNKKNTYTKHLSSTFIPIYLTNLRRVALIIEANQDLGCFVSGARGRNVCRLSFPRSLLAERFLDLTAMAEQQQFYILLGNLMSPDNDIRKQSEVSSQNILSRSINTALRLLARVNQFAISPAHV